MSNGHPGCGQRRSLLMGGLCSEGVLNLYNGLLLLFIIIIIIIIIIVNFVVNTEISNPRRSLDFSVLFPHFVALACHKMCDFSMLFPHFVALACHKMQKQHRKVIALDDLRKSGHSPVCSAVSTHFKAYCLQWAKPSVITSRY